MTKRAPSKVLTWLKNFWRKSWWSKAIILVFSVIFLIFAVNFAVARWWIAANNDKPFTMGVTFIPDYARALGVDPEKNMDALIQDMNVKHFRLTSYWSTIEPEPGSYDFTEMDWQFKKAEAANAKVTLAIGLKQPRWPECHIPDWAKEKTANELQQQLNTFIGEVVDRYKSSPALESYQLENEFLNGFGDCPKHTRDQVAGEYDTVKAHDTSHPIIMSRSDNLPGIAWGKPRPNIVGISVYRRVWNTNLYHGYFNYPLPGWYYAANAGWQKILTGRDTVIHELQMEPWPPNGTFIADISQQEQDKSMNAQMFAGRVAFAKHTGMRQVDLWGSEWWYYRMVKHNDSGVWNEAKKAFEAN
jgi:hypothetical protein